MPPPCRTAILTRPFEARDAAPANRLTNHYIERTAIHFGMQPATDAEFLAAWEQGHKQHPWMAAELSGRFAGYAKAYTWRTRQAYARTAEVGVYVEQEYHRRGVGRALYAALIEACRGAGFHTLVGGIALPNEASVKLHESLGFVHAGTFREVGRKFDRWHDVGFWQLML
jgi:phosphinothricin acetyltransferase